MTKDEPGVEAVARVRKRIDGKAHGFVTISIGDVRAILASLPQDKRIAVLEEALRYLVSLERSIKIDIGSAHKARGAAASEFMREDDADFRRELEAAFDKARAALDGGSNEQG